MKISELEDRLKEIREGDSMTLIERLKDWSFKFAIRSDERGLASVDIEKAARRLEKMEEVLKRIHFYGLVITSSIRFDTRSGAAYADRITNTLIDVAKILSEDEKETEPMTNTVKSHDNLTFKDPTVVPTGVLELLSDFYKTARPEQIKGLIYNILQDPSNKINFDSVAHYFL